VPRMLRSRAPLDAVHLLLEMVADDAARRRTGPDPLRAALQRLSDAVQGAAEEHRRRLDRLGSADTRSVPLTVGAVAGAIGLLVLPTVMLVVPWLDRALAAWPL
jgi:hypothetical protein